MVLPKVGASNLGIRVEDGGVAVENKPEIG
jgi:hypothetical protein